MDSHVDSLLKERSAHGLYPGRDNHPWMEERRHSLAVSLAALRLIWPLEALLTFCAEPSPCGLHASAQLGCPFSLPVCGPLCIFFRPFLLSYFDTPNRSLRAGPTESDPYRRWRCDLCEERVTRSERRQDRIGSNPVKLFTRWAVRRFRSRKMTHLFSCLRPLEMCPLNSEVDIGSTSVLVFAPRIAFSSCGAPVTSWVRLIPAPPPRLDLAL